MQGPSAILQESLYAHDLLCFAEFSLAAGRLPQRPKSCSWVVSVQDLDTLQGHCYRSSTGKCERYYKPEWLVSDSVPGPSSPPQSEEETLASIRVSLRCKTVHAIQPERRLACTSAQMVVVKGAQRRESGRPDISWTCLRVAAGVIDST